MAIRKSKIQLLKSMGWTKEDFAELLKELIDELFETLGNNLFEVGANKTEESYEKIITSLLKDLGFSFRQIGTYYLRDALIFCREIDNPKKPLRQVIYYIIEEKYGVKYENVRACIRVSIHKAFEKPTDLARQLFSKQIKEKGMPSIKEFITEVYPYM